MISGEPNIIRSFSSSWAENTLSISSVHASIEIELYDVAGARRGIFEQEVNNYESKCKESVTSLFANQTSESPPPL